MLAGERLRPFPCQQIVQAFYLLQIAKAARSPGSRVLSMTEGGTRSGGFFLPPYEKR